MLQTRASTAASFNLLVFQAYYLKTHNWIIF